jgi:hypothetical protein
MNFLQTIFMRAVDRPKGILGRLEVYLCKITETVRKNARVHTPRALTVPQGLGGVEGRTATPRSCHKRATRLSGSCGKDDRATISKRRALTTQYDSSWE